MPDRGAIPGPVGIGAPSGRKAVADLGLALSDDDRDHLKVASARRIDTGGSFGHLDSRLRLGAG
jgi:hypothetical protein